MSFADRDALDASVLDWMQRSGQSGVVGDWRTLGEAQLNRKLGALEDDNALTGTLSSRLIDTSAISIIEPMALFITEDDGDERRIAPVDISRLAYDDDAGEPSAWAWNKNDENIVFDCPLDQAYTFRLVSRQRFSLSAGDATNWLLTNHPDVYLAAVIVWGCGYNEDLEGMVMWQALLKEAVPEIKSEIAQTKRAQLRVDPGLMSRAHSGNINDGYA